VIQFSRKSGFKVQGVGLIAIGFIALLVCVTVSVTAIALSFALIGLSM
jgi:hypothetical protein